MTKSMGSQAEAVLQRLKQAAQCPSDAALAAFLGISHQALSRARGNGKVPSAWIPLVAEKTGISTDWLFFGQETAAPQKRAGSFDANVTAMPGEAGSPPDLTMLPLVAARLAAGGGSLENDGETIGHFAFQTDWLCRKGNPDKMVLMGVTGDSMEPEIRNGDMVLVDQGKTQIYGHAFYAIGVNDEIYVKQVETLPGQRLVLRSINPRYSPIEVDLRGDLADSVRVIGRIIWWCREA